MKRLLIISTLFISVATPAFGQIEAGTIELSPLTGIAIPLGDFGDVGKTGFALGAQYSYYASPTVAIGGTFAYNSFGVDDAFTTPGVDIDLTIIELTGHVKFFFGQNSSSGPYLKGLVGLFPIKASASAGGVSVSVTETDFGFGGGLGFQIKGDNNIGGFFEFVIFDIITEGSSTQYAAVRAGTSFFMGGAK